MKKILMAKYGFVRWPEEDFSDDGNRFTCYKVGDRVRVSKLVSDGCAYISARIDGTKLPYEVYSTLPHYSVLDKLNGVRADSLSDNDLFDLCEACLMYEKEYNEAEASIVFPTISEIYVQCMRIQTKRCAELQEIKRLLADDIVRIAERLTDCQWKTVKEYLVNLKKYAAVDAKERARSMLNSRYSFGFVKPDFSELDDSYYYTYLKKMFMV